MAASTAEQEKTHGISSSFFTLTSIAVGSKFAAFLSGIGKILTAAAIFRYFSIQELLLELAEDGKARRVETHCRPLGVVAAIVPSNYPLALLAFKLPAALLAGNTVKPAPTTPLKTLLFGELLAKLVPTGVVNVIADDGSLGA